MTILLRVRGLTAGYGKIQALKGVSLDVEEGGITCLLGPNGAGKTTLMFALTGILKAQEGSVTLRGAELKGLAPHDIVESGVALVPENRLVFPSMTVLENLHAGAYRRSGKREIDADLDKMLSTFPRLRERSQQLAGTLSGGEQQMLAVARAMMSRPKLLLMDEPSIGLAPLVVAEIFRIITHVSREGVTIFLVEQNVHMALKIASHFYLMEQGKVIFSGDPKTAMEDDVIQRAYLGSSAAQHRQGA